MDNLSTDIISKVSTDIITELFKKTFEGLSLADDWIKGRNRKYDPLGLAAKKYAQKMEERYNTMRIFGMTEPIPLRSIYTRVNILEKITASHRLTIDELQRFFDFDKRGFGRSQGTKDGMEVVNDLQKLIVLGKPGAGKTTFLKYIALQALDGQLNESRIPIFVSLKNWSDSHISTDSQMSLMAYIIREFEICDFPDALQFVERMLSHGRCLILLDGFDEVNTDTGDVITQINNFVDKYNKNQYVLSCRIAAYNYCFEKFTDIEIADFSDEQIKSFLNNWFGEGSVKANAAWRRIDYNRPIRELAGTPLLLTILTLAFDETMDFPRNRGELYKEGIDALLKKWDSSRSIKRDEIYRRLSLKRKESMLTRIAAIYFQAGQYFFRQSSLERYIEEFIQNLPNRYDADYDDDDDSVEPDGATILKAIEAQHGLFVERAKGIYSFSHLTFQEYLTAKYIVDNESRGTLWNLVDAHLTNEHWREVFFLVAELLETADRFFKLMQDKIKKIEVSEDIKECVTLILKNASDKRGKLELPLSPSKSIAVVLQYIFKTAGQYVDESARYHSQLDLCVHILGKILSICALSPFGKESFAASVLELEDISSNDYKNIHDSIRKIASDRVTLPVDYLRGNLRLLECLDTDCYLSRDLRNSIYNSLFI